MAGGVTPWTAAVAFACVTAATLVAVGLSGPAVAAMLFAGAGTVLVAGGNRLLRRARALARDRDAEQAGVAAAREGIALKGAHDAVTAATGALDPLLRDARAAPWHAAARHAVARLGEIQDVLRSSKPERLGREDDDGTIPLVGGYVDQLRTRRGEALTAPYGKQESIPRHLPRAARSLLRYLGLVLDEVRGLHNAQIERAVLLLTLYSRAVLVALTPLLGAWAPVPVGLSELSAVALVAWAAAAVVAVATALAAPAIADRAMEDSERGRTIRRRLLRLEVPIAVLLIVCVPAWTAVVFASGWTNWWQRQTPRLRFDWRKLALFVAAVVALQVAGLALAGVPPVAGALQVAAALAAIAVTGGSYGAMLPLSAAILLDVAIGDSWRSLRAARRARTRLLGTAELLDATAAGITADTSVATTAEGRYACEISHSAAEELYQAADRVGRLALFSSQVLDELLREAAARSYLPVADTPAHDRELDELLDRGEVPPAYAARPRFDDPSLRRARVAGQQDARLLREVVVRAYNEAHAHGIDGVRTVVDVERGQLVLYVGNRRRPEDSAGTAGDGGDAIRRLARGLPDGDAKFGPGRASDVGMPGESPWWIVRVSSDLRLLDPRIG